MSFTPRSHLALIGSVVCTSVYAFRCVAETQLQAAQIPPTAMCELSLKPSADH